MKRPIFDDIGSYPLPEGTTKAWLKEAFADVPSHKIALYELLTEALKQKLNAGVEVPTYPQFQNMITQFNDPILDAERTEAPLLIKEAEAKIIELDAFEQMAVEYREKTGEKLKSVGRFIKNAIENAKDYEVACASLDEPSMGLDPRIEEEIR
jgi:5-methyltetrahydropteroyltriglutamate--homocysteine methyltransferase